jgi:flagellar biosynthetic protein FliQ
LFPYGDIGQEGNRMTAPEVLDLGREAIWVLVQAAAPAMLVALIVGTVIGLLQALTQIQESTLVFVPKILAVFVAIVIFMPMMGAVLFGLTEMVFARIATPGG